MDWEETAWELPGWKTALVANLFYVLGELL